MLTQNLILNFMKQQLLKTRLLIASELKDADVE
jgi:hypothetical protein